MSDVRQQTFVPFPNKRAKRDPQDWVAQYSGWMERWKNAYWLCHRLLRSHADVFYGDVLNLPPALGVFDVVIVGSVLEHLRDPAEALESIASLTGKKMVVVTPIIESDEPVARFEPRAGNPDQDFTWWTYSIGLYRELLGILGFEIDRITTAEYWHEYDGRFEPRTTLVATRSRDSEKARSSHNESLDVRLMVIRTPKLDAEQIAGWIRGGAESVAATTPDESMRHRAEAQWHGSFDFKKARQALQRARAKTALRTIKPLRRLRTDQAAVNESLIDALTVIVTLNKTMAAEIAALASEVAGLRSQLANRGPRKHT